MSKEQKILDDLDQMLGIQDAYFHKGVLYVMNSYDVPGIENYLEFSDVSFKYHVVEDEYA